MIDAQATALDLPFRIDGTGRIGSTRELTRQLALRLRSIIGTTPGERVMRPSYGCGAANYVFDVDDPLGASTLTTTVQDAIDTWEPAVEVEDVQILSSDPMDSRVELLIIYRLRSTGERQTANVAVTPTATYGWPS